jgi:hypothetical protein
MNTWLLVVVVLLITLAVMVTPILTDRELVGRRRSAVRLGAVMRVFYVPAIILCLYLLYSFIQWVGHVIE